jgi:ABC-type branched-subunit amino acid transport system ATPase component/ABC-type branched-subunit amino acid transport system permease subunit
MMDIAERTGAALAGAMREARGAWNPWYTAGVVFVVIAALVPAAAPSWVHIDSLANGYYLALAATGLWISVGLAGMPSLGQGAFMAIGAFTVALLTAKAGWPAFPATLVGIVAAAAGGVLTGIGVVRLRPVFIAVTTWILTWTVTIFLLSVRSVSGGAQGLLVPPTLSVSAHYELALVLLVAAILVAASLARGGVGIELRAARQVPAAAAALGVATARRRLGAFVASAAIGGLAGGMAVQLAGVADAGEYGPYLSFRLFVAVLIGGAASALGPAVGVAGLAVVTGAAGLLGSVENVESARFDPMLAALLLVAVLALGGDGIVPLVRSLFRRGTVGFERKPVTAAAPPSPVVHARPERPLLVADGLTKRFGSVVAADGVSFELALGEVCALIGPNGSGKTTVLRMLAGVYPPDAGRVVFDGADLDGSTPRARARLGLVRTLQGSAAFAELTSLENLEVGAGLRRVHGGAVRVAVATPLAREEEAETQLHARAALADVGLDWAADVRAGELAGPEQRLLAVAAALATRPRALLLDEPSAGGSLDDIRRLDALISRLRDAGVAVLLVEHNLRLVRAVADRVIVMAAGSVIAAGRPAEVAADSEVRAAYLGRAAL